MAAHGLILRSRRINHVQGRTTPALAECWHRVAEKGVQSILVPGGTCLAESWHILCARSALDPAGLSMHYDIMVMARSKERLHPRRRLAD